MLHVAALCAMLQTQLGPASAQTPRGPWSDLDWRSNVPKANTPDRIPAILAERSRRDPTTGCLLWTWAVTSGVKSHGYGVVRAGGKNKLAHRVSYEITYGPIPDGLDVLHRCDTPACIEPTHLFLGNDDDNMADMVAKGRQARGERSGAARWPDHMSRSGEGNGRAVLTEDGVRDIRLSKMSQSALSRLYGVSRFAIYAILKCKTWRHVS